MLMNLVINAAEAGGNVIDITTRNLYIDKPIRGYDNIKKGYYVVLAVSDDGTGISPEDIKNIFEPFYTKKIMGRSGTGLGMSVVWSTIQDHSGYINIQSVENQWTRIEIYFPVTDEEIKDEFDALPVEEYTGNKESILVVDDISEQREIAERILEKIGYTVYTVSSGEEAVDFVKNNAPDIIILDMIMDGGIGGLETYKKILEIRPDQKAIIASGFSENQDVKKVQQLGAGSYIKKPYTIENIGMAVKKELNRDKPLRCKE
jgi:CheY-like chemotaxis protein